MGTPSAVPLASPKLDRISLRTMPLSDSTFGPFDPSPGYGPAVSSGISPEDVDADAVDEDVVVEPVSDLLPHAARPNVVTPRPSARSTCRRPIKVPRSKPRPWSTTSSSGLAR